jgi:membrane protein insertase Oxa1/YidC/SpoIIIJ
VLPFALRQVRCESTRSVVTLQESSDTGDAITSCVPPAAVTDDVAALAADNNLLVGGLQRFIDWIHVTYDLPWWLSIVVATTALRTVILPAVVVQMRNTAKLTVRVGLSI